MSIRQTLKKLENMATKNAGRPMVTCTIPYGLEPAREEELGRQINKQHPGNKLVVFVVDYSCEAASV